MSRPEPLPRPNAATLTIAVIGAGPVGLALALQAARALPDARITLFEARTLDKDVSGDPRALALSLGSVQLLERLGVWQPDQAQPILEVHVSQAPPSGPSWLGEPELRIRAREEKVPMLGAVTGYGSIVSRLQAAWVQAVERDPQRLQSRFGAPVAALKDVGGATEVDAGIVERFDLAVVAEGGVRAERALSTGQATRPVRGDYRQTAWVGQAAFEPGTTRRAAGVAFERFTRAGPVALLPLRDGRASLVWCVRSDDDPVAELNDTQRVAVLNSLLHPSAGRIASVTPLKAFALSLEAERTLAQGRTVRIGNAAQTLHPVAGQGLNLGLRDAFELVHALARRHDIDAVLRRLDRQRAPDRWAMILATDFLARSFTWVLPGAGAARGLGIAALQALGPARSALARRMMYGSR